VLDRPFRVLGAQQIAIGALDRGSPHTLWVEAPPEVIAFAEPRASSG
jgi:hypothetical protein